MSNNTQREIGALNMMQLLDGLEAFSLGLFTVAFKWSPEQIQLLLKDVRQDAKKKSVHMLHNL